MSAIEDTHALMDRVSGGSLGLDVDVVMKESAKNLLIQQGTPDPSYEQINEVYNLWTKDGKTDVKYFYKQKIAEMGCKYQSLVNTLGNIPAEVAGITAAAASLTAAPAAIPMYKSVKSEVETARNQLFDCLRLCCEMNIAVPSALSTLVSTLTTCIGLVSKLP